MNKLIKQYRFSPNQSDAKKLVTYVNNHPMALCFISPDEALLLNEARNHATPN